MAFAKNVSNFGAKVNKRLDRLMQKTTRASYYQILVQSRVATGKFRGNWRIGINRTDLRVTKNAPARSAGTTTGQPPTRAERAFAGTTIRRIRRDDTVYITNSVEYAPYVPDAPSAVTLTRQKVLARINRLIRETRREIPDGRA